MKSKINCALCHNALEVEPFNAGHGDIWFFYCDRCPRVVLIPIYEELKPRGFYGEEYIYHLSPNPTGKERKASEAALDKQTQAIVNSLKDCPCGGKFIAGGGPRCPECLQPLAEESVRTQLRYAPLGLETWPGWRGGIVFVINGLMVSPEWREDRLPKKSVA